MSEGKIIVGLDIGTTKVACMVGKKSENGKIEILGYGKSVSIYFKPASSRYAIAFCAVVTELISPVL